MRTTSLLIILSLTALVYSKPYCVLQDGDSYRVAESDYTDSCIAFANYEPTLNSIGWDKLYVSFKEGGDLPDYKKMEAAGFLEGFLTSDRIYSHYKNLLPTTFPSGEIPANVLEFFTENQNFLAKNFHEKVENPEDTSSAEFIYWNAVIGIQFQLEGILAGHNAAATEDQQMRMVDLHVIASFGDIFDIQYYKNPSAVPKFESMDSAELMKYFIFNSHCSAIIKVKEDLSDVWFSHNSWFTYSAMTRIFKEYDFPLKGAKANKVTMSSYPGNVTSNDDYYVTSSDFVVIETTNNMFDQTLFEKLSPETLLIWHRVMTANRLAESSQHWTELFSRLNSGTYNNQYMVTDLSKIDTTERKIEDNAFWIAEQVPGYVHSQDVTQHLRHGYWPSYNVPFSPEIRKRSGVEEFLKKRPDMRPKFDYDSCARANIFRRDQGNVSSLEEMKKLIRYNDFRNDPLSLGNPGLSLSCRSDLADSHGSCSGAYDAKVASINELKGREDKTIHMVAGPTDQLEDLDWNSAYCNSNNREGLNDVHMFKWTTYESFHSHSKVTK